MKFHLPVIIMNKNNKLTWSNQRAHSFIFSLNEIVMREYMILLIIIVNTHVLVHLAMSIPKGHFFKDRWSCFSH